MLKTTRLPDVPASKKNHSNNEIVRFGIIGDDSGGKKSQCYK